MQDLIIVTDQPITLDSCFGILKNEFKSLNVLSNDNETLYLKKSDKGFEMWFSPEDRIDMESCEMQDYAEICPNKKAFLTNLSFSHLSVAKRVVKALINSYGKMWIQIDEEEDWNRRRFY